MQETPSAKGKVFSFSAAFDKTDRQAPPTVMLDLTTDGQPNDGDPAPGRVSARTSAPQHLPTVSLSAINSEQAAALSATRAQHEEWKHCLDQQEAWEREQAKQAALGFGSDQAASQPSQDTKPVLTQASEVAGRRTQLTQADIQDAIAQQRQQEAQQMEQQRQQQQLEQQQLALQQQMHDKLKQDVLRQEAQELERSQQLGQQQRAQQLEQQQQQMEQASHQAASELKEQEQQQQWRLEQQQQLMQQQLDERLAHEQQRMAQLEQQRQTAQQERMQQLEQQYQQRAQDLKRTDSEQLDTYRQLAQQQQQQLEAMQRQLAQLAAQPPQVTVEATSSLSDDLGQSCGSMESAADSVWTRLKLILEQNAETLAQHCGDIPPQEARRGVLRHIQSSMTPQTVQPMFEETDTLANVVRAACQAVLAARQSDAGTSSPDPDGMQATSTDTVHPHRVARPSAPTSPLMARTRGRMHGKSELQQRLVAAAQPQVDAAPLAVNPTEQAEGWMPSTMIIEPPPGWVTGYMGTPPVGTTFIHPDIADLQNEWLIGHFDGGARNNGADIDDTGETLSATGWGAWIKNERQGVIWKGRGPAGPDPTRGTNNVGEACGLLGVVAAARCLGGQHVHIKGDSQIMIDALNGVTTQIGGPLLRSILHQTHLIKDSIRECSAEQLPRDQNSDADTLVNEAIDDVLAQMDANDPRLNAAATGTDDCVVAYAAHQRGYAIEIRRKDGALLHRKVDTFADHGTTLTQNQANYKGAQAAIEYAHDLALAPTYTLLFPDQLVLNHLTGTFAVKSTTLRPFYNELNQTIATTHFAGAKAVMRKTDNYSARLENLKRAASTQNPTSIV
jgi:ribonuclease HI